jgi:UDP-N-acetylglucosamine--N-acetylmuramyl-(pentapeptide) pyrophosphoryl-undecaprenol N-acetylglucosamine transferase
LFIGSKHGFERGFAEQHNLDYAAIPTGKLRRYFSWQNFLDIFKVGIGVIAAWIKIWAFKADVVFSTGGFVSVPVCVAGFLTRTPVLVHEQTVAVGLANRLTAKFATHIMLAHVDARRYFPAHKTAVTGQPVRAALLQGTRDGLYKRFALNKQLPTLYFTGGSQGAKIINEALFGLLSDLRQKYNIIHQFGKIGINQGIERFRAQINHNAPGGYVVEEFFFDEIADILCGSDLLIGRSGAGTVADAIATGIPAIFIPLKIATLNEQFRNAELMARKQAAVIITEANFTPAALQTTIDQTMAKIDAYKVQAHSLGGENGSGPVVDLILKFSQK